MIRSLVLGALVLLAPEAFAASGCAPAEVFLVRHAEKAVSADDPDVVLSEAGQRRAAALAAWFGQRQVDAIYATHLRRTQHTAAPLATARGLDIRVLPAGDTQALVSRLRERHCGERVLAVGHSNTVPKIAAALGAEAPVIGEDDFGTIFVLEAGSRALRRESFGDPAK
jgi:phosphohistidine phosphatase SixA